MDARNSPSYFKTFYTRRFFRHHSHLLSLDPCVHCVGGRRGSFALRARSNSGLLMPFGLRPFMRTSIFLQNLMVIPFAGLAGAWFGHLWSLAVKEEFHTGFAAGSPDAFAAHCWPFSWLGVIAAAPLLRIVLLVEPRERPAWSAASMPCRADSLAIGMLAAVFWRKETFRRWLSERSGVLYAILAALFTGVVALWMWAPESQTFGMESIGFTWLAAFYIVVLLLALVQRNVRSRGWLEWRGCASWEGYRTARLYHSPCRECFLSFGSAKGVAGHHRLARRGGYLFCSASDLRHRVDFLEDF